MGQSPQDMEKSDNAGSRPSQDNTISDGTQESETNEKTDEYANSVAQEDQATITEPTTSEEWEYITGWKLVAVLGVVSLACFTMLLDTSIVVTVSSINSPYELSNFIKGNPKNNK
jgi:hypothetical protein